MSNYTEESSMFLKLEGSSTKMIEALQTYLVFEYEFFETPADIVESAIFEMYSRIVMCGTLDDKQKREVNDRKMQKTRNEQRHFNVPHSVLLQSGLG